MRAAPRQQRWRRGRASPSLPSRGATVPQADTSGPRRPGGTSRDIRAAAAAVAELASRPPPPVLLRSLRDLGAAAASLHRALRPSPLVRLLSLSPGGAADEAIRLAEAALDVAERAVREEADHQRGIALAIERAAGEAAAGPAGIAMASARARAAAHEALLRAAGTWRAARGTADLAEPTARLRDAAEALARSLEQDAGAAP